jgi:hypothetical protein
MHISITILVFVFMALPMKVASINNAIPISESVSAKELNDASDHDDSAQDAFEPSRGPARAFLP